MSRPRYAVWAVNGDEPVPEAARQLVPDPVRVPKQSKRLKEWAARKPVEYVEPVPYRRTCCRCLQPCREDYRRRGISVVERGYEIRYTCEDCAIASGERKKAPEDHDWKMVPRQGRIPEDGDSNGGWGNVIRALEDWDDGKHDGA